MEDVPEVSNDYRALRDVVPDKCLRMRFLFQACTSLVHVCTGCREIRSYGSPTTDTILMSENSYRCDIKIQRRVTTGLAHDKELSHVVKKAPLETILIIYCLPQPLFALHVFKCTYKMSLEWDTNIRRSSPRSKRHRLANNLL